MQVVLVIGFGECFFTASVVVDDAIAFTVLLTFVRRLASEVRLNNIPEFEHQFIALLTHGTNSGEAVLGVVLELALLECVFLEEVEKDYDLLNARVVECRPSAFESFRFTIDDVLSPFEQCVVAAEVWHGEVVFVKTIENLFVLLDVTSNDGEVEDLDEVGNVEARLAGVLLNFFGGGGLRL